MGSDGLTVRAAGEDAVLAAIREVIDPHNERVREVCSDDPLITPPGDDAAVVSFAAAGSTAQVIMTTDTMSEDQDFRLSWWAESSAPTDIGTKAAAQNLSDVNAMGGRPTALLVSLTLSAEITLEWIQGFYRGVVRACSQPGGEQCLIAGGDLGSGEKISVTITALGELPEDQRPLTRVGARPREIFAVAGELGRAAAGLQLLERKLQTGSTAEASGGGLAVLEQCRNAQRQPRPPLRAGREAAAAGATAGIDVSDGLLRDAERLAESSEVSIELDDEALKAEAEGLIPVARFLGFSGSAEALTWVLSGGEDYALLATFPSEATLPAGFRRIGTVHTVGSDAPRVSTGFEASEHGWDSFRPS